MGFLDNVVEYGVSRVALNRENLNRKEPPFKRKHAKRPIIGRLVKTGEIFSGAATAGITAAAIHFSGGIHNEQVHAVEPLSNSAMSRSYEPPKAEQSLVITKSELKKTDPVPQNSKSENARASAGASAASELRPLGLEAQGDMRSKIISEIMPGLSESDMKAVSDKIDSEMKNRTRNNIGEIIDKYDSLVTHASIKTGVAKYIIYGMLGAESDFDPAAEAPDSDAVGIAMFTPIAAAEEGIYDSAKQIDLRKDASAAIPALADYVARYSSSGLFGNKLSGSNIGFGIQAFKTGPGDLSDYLKVYTAEKNSPPPNAYSVIENASHLLKDPADKLYLIRVAGEAEQVLQHIGKSAAISAQR